jgi:hypothetical protein
LAKRAYQRRQRVRFSPISHTTTESAGGVVVRQATGAKTQDTIPPEILNDEKLLEAISPLPSNYNFEIHKTLWRLKSANAKRVALQFPEGLLAYSCVLCDIFERFAHVQTVVMVWLFPSKIYGVRVTSLTELVVWTISPHVHLDVTFSFITGTPV